MAREKQPQWLRVQHAAWLLNVSDSTIRRCLADGELEGVKIRGVVRVDRDSLSRLIRQRRYVDVVRNAKVWAWFGWPRRDHGRSRATRD